MRPARAAGPAGHNVENHLRAFIDISLASVPRAVAGGRGRTYSYSLDWIATLPFTLWLPQKYGKDISSCHRYVAM